MVKIYFSVTNDLSSDQRVHRVISSLVKTGASVCLVGRKLPDSLPLEQREYGTHRMSLLFKKGFLFYAFFNFRLFLFLMFRGKIDFLVSNDLDTLPANYLVSKIRRVQLIYDSHEYFTEVPELIGRKRVKKFWLKIEQMILPHIKYAYTVSKPIADIYKSKYGVDFQLIHNFPLRNKESVNIELPFDKGNDKVLIYQGAINIGRGLETLIEVVGEMEKVRLIIAGDGDIRKSLEKYAKEKFPEKIYFTGKIQFSALHNLTKLADAGVSLEEDLGLNYRYAMPNKLFDYTQAEIPVLVSDLPEMKRIVEKYNIGIIVESRDKATIHEAIGMLLFNDDKRAEWKSGLKKAATELCWENEEGKLLDIFFAAGLTIS